MYSEEVLTINKIEFSYCTDNPMDYLDLKNIDFRLLNRLIDLFLIVGVQKWYISEEVDFPIPITWVTSVNVNKSTLEYQAPTFLVPKA